MNKHNYLNQPEVAGFIDYLRAIIVSGDGALNHTYTDRLDRGPGVVITGFQHARLQCKILGRSLDAYRREQAILSERLANAIAKEEDDDARRELDLLIVCLDILRWRRISNGGTTAWLSGRASLIGLSKSIRSGVDALLSDDSDLEIFSDRDHLRSDSMATNIYALANPKSISYDNRIAATLSKLVVTYLERIEAEETPESLKFMVNLIDERSNPTTDIYKFTRRSNGIRHAYWNQRANWIAGSLSSDEAVRESFQVDSAEDACRAIEEAMYIIGADIRKLSVNEEITADSSPAKINYTPSERNGTQKPIHVSELVVAIASTSRPESLSVTEEELIFATSDKQDDLMTPILKPYNQTPMSYFGGIALSQPSAPWALICLPKEYSLAGHITISRPDNSDIFFSPYALPPTPTPSTYVPRVGTIIIESRSGLEQAADTSPMFNIAWEALKSLPPTRRWLVLLDSLSEEFLSETTPGDDELWLAIRGIG